jgi:hypothetical protein
MRIINKKKEDLYGIIQNKKGYPGGTRYKEKIAGKKSKGKSAGR